MCMSLMDVARETCAHPGSAVTLKLAQSHVTISQINSEHTCKNSYYLYCPSCNVSGYLYTVPFLIVNI